MGTLGKLPLQHVAVFGSTGSIGTAALEVIAALGAPYKAVALTAHANAALLTEQVERFRPEVAVLTGSEPTESQRRRIANAGTKLAFGVEAMRQVAGGDEVGGCGTVLASVVGAAGLPAVLEAVRAGKRVALANKESLVVAGGLLMPLARASGATILPVDSEHSALFQACLAGRRGEVSKFILTASGGPFRTSTAEAMERATAAEALAHPTWKMGSKITVDSATLMNKAFELIEARWLFDARADEIEVVVHPQSIVHSMVEFVDGSTLAQLSPPDMKTPIQYALTYPDRVATGVGKRMDWGKAQSLTFEPPDRVRFPAIDLAYEVARSDGTLGAVMNAANEIAVDAFLKGRVRFGAITRTVAGVMGEHRTAAAAPAGGATLEQLMAADAWARSRAAEMLAREG